MNQGIRGGLVMVWGLMAVCLACRFADAADTEVFRDRSRSIDARAADLLSRLTLDEKLGLMHADGGFTATGLKRFNIRHVWMSDGPQGVRDGASYDVKNLVSKNGDFATAMPANIGLAAAFDEELAKRYGSVIGEEALARGKDIMLCPGMNIMRTPVCGRNCEYFGEDPFLASRMAVGYVQGIQSHGVAACAKHFAANNQENSRNTINVEMDDRTLHEIYLPAFKAAVIEGHVWTVMSAYNSFRGQFCSENDLLLNQILKRDWHFPGIVISDWVSTHSTKAAANGLDLEMPLAKYLSDQSLKEALESGALKQAQIDDMAMRHLRVMAAVGLLDPSDAREKGSIETPAHLAIARQVAASACVLLKNQNSVLPLDVGKIKSIAVIGSNATTPFSRDGFSAVVTTRHEVTALEGITARAGKEVKISYADGYVPAGRDRRPGKRNAELPPESKSATDDAMLAEAADIAAKSDVAIVLAGVYRWEDQEGGDRGSLHLPAGQAEVIQRVIAANPRTVVVLSGGGPVEMDPWLEKTPALVMAWYGGSEAGNGLAEILFGDANPSAKLPCTFPRKLSDSPAHALKAYPGRNGIVTYEEGLLVGYRWFDEKGIEPLFPFGFGLSYSKFEFSDLKLVEKDGSILVQARLANVGQRAGAEVVQVYVQAMKPSVSRPVRELKGFEKIEVKPGEKANLEISLPISAFAFYDPGRKAWVAEEGEYTISVGNSSRELPLKAIYHLSKTSVIED